MDHPPDRPLPPPDWRMPAGVNRGLWDYLHDSDLARNYDQSLAGSSLFEADEAFVAEHCPAGGRLVDLGCGTGRLLLSFARRGHRVVGVDLSAAMLTVAADKAKGAGLAVDLVRANLVDLRCLAERSFESAVCLFSTLGMIRGEGRGNEWFARPFGYCVRGVALSFTSTIAGSVCGIQQDGAGC